MRTLCVLLPPSLAVRSPLLLIALLLSACGSTDSLVGIDEAAIRGGLAVAIVGPSEPVDLLAGRTMDVGDVSFTDDGTTLTIEIVLDAGWCLLEVHAHAGDTVDDVPRTGRGNPIPGRFAGGEEGLGCVQGTHTLELPLPDGGDDDAIVVAVHAVVVASACPESCAAEGAWADGTGFVERGPWATYVTYAPDASPAAGACPTITAASNVVEIAPPAAVDFDALTGTTPFVFSEGAHEVTNLPLDDPDVLVTATVCSYYVHFDIGSGAATSDLRVAGSITFSEEITGLIILGSAFGSQVGTTLCDTNGALGAAGTDYEDPDGWCGPNEDNRGLETGPVNLTFDAASFAGSTVQFDLRATNLFHDAFRVVLPAAGE